MPPTFPWTVDSATPELALPLLTAGSATGSGYSWPGGLGEFVAKASSWGGATAKLQASFDNGSTYADVTGAPQSCSLTADGFGLFELGQCLLRVFISGSPTSLTATARRVEY